MVRTQRRIDTLQTVELAEGMEIHLRAAGPFLRLVAYLIDLIAKGVAIFIFGTLIDSLGGIIGDRVAAGIFSIGSFLIFWFYHVFFEVSRLGATLGKMAMGLRVVNEAGGPISIGQGMIRSFIRGVEIVIPFAPLVAFFHPRFQRLGDLAAETLVIYSRARLDPMTPGPPSRHSVPVTVALSREEEAAVLSFRDRSGGWSEQRRTELVNHLRAVTGSEGRKGVAQILGMANWLEARR